MRFRQLRTTGATLMTQNIRWLMIAWILLIRSVVAAEDREQLFEARIRPVLVNSCLRCHGAVKASGQLRVDSRAALLKGGESGAAIIPGKPEDSLLIKAIQRLESVSAMPPDKDKAIRPEQVAAFAQWVREGAIWPESTARFEVDQHWAFEPVREIPIPDARDPQWIRTTVDAFIRARQQAENVTPGPAADKVALIRRATFDLTGLPPTPEEVQAFEADPSPNASELCIERLLRSPRYGEHWGRHWLDLVRYADTAGENSDHPLPHAWRYRNWVIQAFNDNKPFDEFIREQVAGDLIAADGPADKYPDRIIATGYLAIARRFGHDIDKDMHLTYEDTIDTLGKSILGLTIACARCHDHKFDPISSRDYYGLYGIFESTRFAFPGCEPKQQPKDLVPLLPPDEFSRSIQPVLQLAASLDASIKQMTDELTTSARRLKEVAVKNVTVLSTGTIPDGGSSEFEGVVRVEDKTASQIAVKAGDLVQLSVTPNANHGADSTLVELVISEVGGAGRKWNIADLIDSFSAGNPHADSYGNALTWRFFDTRDGLLLLPEFLDAIDGKRELKAWRNGDTPSVFVNTSKDPVKVWTTLPPRSFLMHPGPSGPVAVAWLCPFDGVITVQGRIADAHPAGDGVGWILEQFHSTAKPGEPSELLSLLNKPVELRESLQATRKLRADLTPKLSVPVAYAVAEGEAKNTRMQKRGEPADLGEEIPRKFLDILGGQQLKEQKSSGRKELASWLTNPANPLTARVFVNRVWQWHFGRGLVTTPNDFGSRGAAPTHPQLLDHLAFEFMKSGWNIKDLHRRIMRSATYQLSVAENTEPSELYTTFQRRRLTAEELRDALLQVSGQLDPVPGESHPFPPESTWSFTQHGPFAAEYESQKRSVYVMQKRNRRTRFFALFDGPDPNASTPVRDVTIVPTQALFFLNDPFLHLSADKLAARLESAPTDRDKVIMAHRLACGKQPTPMQLDDALEFARENSWPAYCRVLLSSNEFLFVD